MSLRVKIVELFHILLVILILVTTLTLNCVLIISSSILYKLLVVANNYKFSLTFYNQQYDIAKNHTMLSNTFQNEINKLNIHSLH